MTRLFAVVAFLLTVVTASAARQDSLGAARELYGTAAYDEALAMLDRLRGSSPAAGADARAIEQYRAYCLFALGRSGEAEKAVETVVSIEPTWEIADTEAPPRIVALFNSVRTRALPSLVRERFNAAKALYTAKKNDEAATAFSNLILLLENPAIAKAAGPNLADLKTVSIGFRDLAKAASEQAAAKAAAPPAPAPTTPALSASTGTAPANGSAPGGVKPVEAVADPVLPPSIITQQIPRPMSMAVPLGGEAIVVMDVLIDELGRVERAAIRQSVNRAYEAQLLAASRAWRYTPATRAGKPVKYVKTIEITLTAR